MRYLSYIIPAFILSLCFAIPAHALTVSPAKVEITGDPGTTLQGEVEIFNEQEGSRTFYSTAENFEPNGDSGAPYFVGAKDGLATWISTEESVTLESGEHRKIPFSIQIPENTEPGGYFAAMFWGSRPSSSQEGGEVSIGGKIGVLVLLRVSGDVPESGGLIDFQTVGNQRFFSKLPVTMTYRFNNTGGDRIVPLGDIKIKNTFRLNAETLPANKNEGSILPNSTRKFEIVWAPDEMGELADTEPGFLSTAKEQLRDFHFGWYTAKMNVTFGITNQVASDAYHFFIIPWHLLSILLALFVLLALVGRVVLRKYNAHIISQAKMK